MNRGDILKAAEEENVRFMRLQFTDILGIIKNVEIPRSQFEKALDGQIMFDGSSIEGFVRIEESDMLLTPRLSTPSGSFPGQSRRLQGGADDLRHLHAGRLAVPRLPADDAQAAGRARSRHGLHDEGGPGGRVLPLPQGRERGADDRDARRRRLLRPDAGRPGRRGPARHRDRAGGDGLRGRGGAPRGGAGAARDRLQLRRCADTAPTTSPRSASW